MVIAQMEFLKSHVIDGPARRLHDGCPLVAEGSPAVGSSSPERGCARRSDRCRCRRSAPVPRWAEDPRCRPFAFADAASTMSLSFRAMPNTLASWTATSRPSPPPAPVTAVERLLGVESVAIVKSSRRGFIARLRPARRHGTSVGHRMSIIKIYSDKGWKVWMRTIGAMRPHSLRS
jgi:hypothetical protein